MIYDYTLYIISLLKNLIRLYNMFPSKINSSSNTQKSQVQNIWEVR